MHTDVSSGQLVAGELQTLSEAWSKSPVDPQDRCVGS